MHVDVKSDRIEIPEVELEDYFRPQSSGCVCFWVSIRPSSDSSLYPGLSLWIRYIAQRQFVDGLHCVGWSINTIRPMRWAPKKVAT